MNNLLNEVQFTDDHSLQLKKEVEKTLITDVEYTLSLLTTVLKNKYDRFIKCDHNSDFSNDQNVEIK